MSIAIQNLIRSNQGNSMIFYLTSGTILTGKIINSDLDSVTIKTGPTTITIDPRYICAVGTADD